MHSLQYRGGASHAPVNMSVSEEVRSQIAVQSGLDCSRRVDPEGRVEEDVVQQLPGEKGFAEGLH